MKNQWIPYTKITTEKDEVFHLSYKNLLIEEKGDTFPFAVRVIDLELQEKGEACEHIYKVCVLKTDKIIDRTRAKIYFLNEIIKGIGMELLDIEEGKMPSFDNKYATGYMIY